MNDFTKEELGIIFLDININIKKAERTGLKVSPSYEALKDKVEAMIDNYCEHHWAFYLSKHGNVLRCTKCDKEIPK